MAKLKENLFVVILIVGFAKSDILSSKISGQATYYNLGLTACGTYHGNDDYVGAVGWPYWTTPNPNLDPICNTGARITNPRTGKVVTVWLRDICGSCKYNNIDLSPIAFQALGEPLSVGMFPVTWEFVQERDFISQNRTKAEELY